MKNIIRYILTVIRMTFWKLLWIRPVQTNVYIFMSYDGEQYSDSPRVLSEYIHEKKPEIKIVWAMNEKNIISEIPDYVKQIGRHSFEFKKTITSAAVIVTNNSISSYIPVRRKQIFLNTWHGGSPTKTVGFCETNPNPYYKYHFSIQDNKTTAILSSSRFFSEDVVKKSFRFRKTEILELGLPKNDILFRNHKVVEEKVRKYFGLNKETGIVLYAPTFRGDANNSTFLNKNDMILPRECINWFEKKYCRRFVFLFRAHHTMKIANVDGSISATDYPDMQDLLCAADFLITDYSSCMHDFSLMNKPVFLYIPDYTDYMKDRGFYYDIPTMPFPYAYNRTELEKIISEFNKEKYISEVKDYHKRMGNLEDGKATERVYEWLEGRLKIKRK